MFEEDRTLSAKLNSGAMWSDVSEPIRLIVQLSKLENRAEATLTNATLHSSGRQPRSQGLVQRSFPSPLWMAMDSTAGGAAANSPTL